MDLSREMEEKIMEENMVKIHRAVDNFAIRCKAPAVSIPHEDFVQEVALMFLRYIRKCDSMDQINRFPWYDAMHCMSELVLEFQPVSVPKRMENFRDVIHMMPQTIPYDVAMTNGIDVDGMSRHWVEDKDTQMDFESFMATQDDAISRLAAMKVYGMTSRNIAAQCGVSGKTITKKLQKLRSDFDKFFEEDENDG